MRALDGEGLLEEGARLHIGADARERLADLHHDEVRIHREVERESRGELFRREPDMEGGAYAGANVVHGDSTRN